MLTLTQILNVWRMRADCGDPGVPVPRDHCSPEYYASRRLEDLQRRQGLSEGQVSDTREGSYTL